MTSVDGDDSYHELTASQIIIAKTIEGGSETEYILSIMDGEVEVPSLVDLGQKELELIVQSIITQL